MFSYSAQSVQTPQAASLADRAHQWIRQLLYSPCRLCGKFDRGLEICQDCHHQLLHSPWGMGSLALDDYRIPVIWREAYGGPLTDIVMQAKYHGDWGSARFLGRSLGRLPRPWLGPTPLIIPIPLASTRLANRGFNQSQFIAQGVAKAWQAPLRVRWLRKTKASARQASLQRQERQENLKGVFWACRHLRDQRVVLVDDIMTSGATLREAARAVATGGGQVIAAAVIARVHHDREPLQSKQKHTPYVQRRPV